MTTAECIMRITVCQYIAGDPLNGGEKCSRPVVEGSAYCAEHEARCKLRAGNGSAGNHEVKNAGEDRLPGDAESTSGSERRQHGWTVPY